jgi:hypothetical protein
MSLEDFAVHAGDKVLMEVVIYFAYCSQCMRGFETNSSCLTQSIY